MKPPDLRFMPIRLIGAVLAITGLVLMLLYLQGMFTGEKVAPGSAVATEGKAERWGDTTTVERIPVEEIRSWPGTVHSYTLAQIAPRIKARIVKVNVEVGNAVKKGEVIAVLDDREVRAKVGEARAALAGAQAQNVRAQADLKRMQELVENEAATPRDYDACRSQANTAAAKVMESQRMVDSVEVMLGESSVRAPFDGKIVERFSHPGDMGTPEKAIVSLQDPQHLRVEFNIPESCAGAVKPGMELDVEFNTLGKTVTTTVEDITPAADPVSRTVLVKAMVNPQAGLQPGAFGWVKQSCGKRDVLLVPIGAVNRVGQLEIVRLLSGDRPRSRHVRTGKRYGDRVEILSGLQEGEKLLLPEEPR